MQPRMWLILSETNDCTAIVGVSPIHVIPSHHRRHQRAQNHRRIDRRIKAVNKFTHDDHMDNGAKVRAIIWQISWEWSRTIMIVTCWVVVRVRRVPEKYLVCDWWIFCSSGRIRFTVPLLQKIDLAIGRTYPPPNKLMVENYLRHRNSLQLYKFQSNWT